MSHNCYESVFHVVSYNQHLDPCFCEHLQVQICDFTMKQKQHCTEICEDLCQQAPDDATLMLKIITGNESWVYNLSSQWKSCSLQDQRRHVMLVFSSTVELFLWLPFTIQCSGGDPVQLADGVKCTYKMGRQV